MDVEWWRWTAAAVVVVLLVVLLLLWFDSLRDEPGATVGSAVRKPALSAIGVPVLAAAAFLLPWWGVLVLVAVPALAVVAMALAS